MTLYEKTMIACEALAVVGFLMAVLVMWKRRLEIRNIYFFFFVWAAIVLFEYYFLGQNSYIHMDDEGAHFIPYYSYLVNFHLGGQFAHHVTMGFDAYAAQSPGAEWISPDRFLISVLPTWIAILLHKFLLIAVGFSGTYLLCRRFAGSDMTAAAVIAAFFVVSNEHLMVITYGVGAGLAFLPMTIYVFVVRAEERTYFPQVICIAVLAALYIKPTHALSAMIVGLALSAILLNRVRWRVAASLGILLAFVLLNWGEVLYAMYLIAPFTERGGDIPGYALDGERIGQIWRTVIIRTIDIRVFGIGLVALMYLWLKRSPMRWRGSIALFGPLVVLFFILLFPWEIIGLDAVKNISHYYVLLAFTALLLPLLAEAIRVSATAYAGVRGDRRQLATTLIFATAIGMMIFFKAFNFANLLYYGGQSQYRTIDTLAERTWGRGDPSRVLTLRVPDLGPEPGVIYGFYGLESVDMFLAIMPRQVSAFFRHGFSREANQEDPRQFIDWSKWVDGRYLIGEHLPLSLLRAANVGFLLSPIPMEAEGISLVAGPPAPPMTKDYLRSHTLAYFRERIRRLFDFNDLYIYALNDPMPQVFAAKRVISLPQDADDASVLRALARNVSDRPALWRTSQAMSLDAAKASLRVESFQKTRDGFDARLSAPEGGVVVVNTPIMPFWRAEADGRPLPIISVNLIHMAVVVPPGARELRFRYHRPTLGDAFRNLIE